MEELLTELRNKVLYLRNIEELSAKGELILLHKLNTMEKQLNIHSVIKSFYCYDKDTQEGACKYQCDECIDLDDNI